MLVDTDLNMAGYRGDAVPAMQERMIDAMAAIPGVSSVALVSNPPLHATCCNASNVFTDETDLRPSTAAADAEMFSISPGYFRAAGTAMLTGRDFTWQDDKNAPRVAVINREFARRIFRSVGNATGRYYKMPDGKRIQVVGIVEDGKYSLNLNDPLPPAMFLPILQSPSTETYAVVRSSGDAQQLAAAIRTKLRDLDSGLPSFIQTWNKAMDGALFPSRMAALSLGGLGILTSGSKGSPIEGRETCRTQRFGLKTRHSMLGSKSDREGPGPRPSTTSGRRRFSIRTPERPLVALLGIYCVRCALRG